MSKYNASPKARAARAKYRSSPRGKGLHQKANARYFSSLKGKRALAKYRNSPKGKARNNRYNTSSRGRDTQQERGWRRQGINMTAELYDALLTAQGGVCALCGKSPNKRSLAVDHDHTTGRIRGLLCFHCNRYVVSALDVIGIDRFISYLYDLN